MHDTVQSVNTIAVCQHCAFAANKPPRVRLSVGPRLRTCASERSEEDGELRDRSAPSQHDASRRVDWRQEECMRGHGLVQERDQDRPGQPGHRRILESCANRGGQYRAWHSRGRGRYALLLHSTRVLDLAHPEAELLSDVFGVQYADGVCRLCRQLDAIRGLSHGIDASVGVHETQLAPNLVGRTGQQRAVCS
eukprot:2808088-Rhodomonas_salina.2